MLYPETLSYLAARGYDAGRLISEAVGWRQRPGPVGSHSAAPFFPVVLWMERGLGYHVAIYKDSYPKREYQYGPFAKGQMRGYLNRLSAKHSEFASVDRMLDLVQQEQVALLVDVDASTLSKIWRSGRVRGKTYIDWPGQGGSRTMRLKDPKKSGSPKIFSPEAFTRVYTDADTLLGGEIPPPGTVLTFDNGSDPRRLLDAWGFTVQSGGGPHTEYRGPGGEKVALFSVHAPDEWTLMFESRARQEGQKITGTAIRDKWTGAVRYGKANQSHWVVIRDYGMDEMGWDEDTLLSFSDRGRFERGWAAGYEFLPYDVIYRPGKDDYVPPSGAEADLILQVLKEMGVESLHHESGRARPVGKRLVAVRDTETGQVWSASAEWPNSSLFHKDLGRRVAREMGWTDIEAAGRLESGWVVDGEWQDYRHLWSEEKILLPAVRNDDTGDVHVAPKTHPGLLYDRGWSYTNTTSGFVTDTGRFVDREEAARLLGVETASLGSEDIADVWHPGRTW